MNPFSRPSEQEVTKLALAPSNPPKEYARGSSDMLKKLLSISENTRRLLSQEPAGGAGELEQNRPPKREAVTVSLLGGKQRAGERRAGTERGHGHLDARAEKARDPPQVEDVIDLVGSDDDVPGPDGQADGRTGVTLGNECCSHQVLDVPLKSQTGVALFDVFDEEQVDDDQYAEEDYANEDYAEEDYAEDQYADEYVIEGENGYTDLLRDGNPAPYGLPVEVEGADWWRKLPDFQPISSIIRGGNRDMRGEAVHVDFLGQFKGTRISSPSGTSAPGGRRSAASTKAGHWETRDGQRTFISATGTALTGAQAYREYTKGAKGAKRSSSSKPRRRKKKKR